ncbi:glycoside hydrolase family protein [bacterium]|nr:glycoside hydrolase family protein [bacterium]MBU1993799.1 glycoside hydrolase family protein [bacterium]
MQRFLLMLSALFFVTLSIQAKEINHVFNGDFRFGELGWNGRFWYKKKIDYLVTGDIELLKTAEGLVAPVNENFYTRVQSTIFKVPKNKQLFLKLRAKASRKTTVKMGVFNPNVRKYESVTLGTSFQDKTMKVTFPSDVETARIDFEFQGEDANVTISNISLVSTEKVVDIDEKVYIDTKKKLAVYEFGSPIVFKYGIEAESPLIKWKLMNHNEELLKSGVLNDFSGILTFDNLELGWYKLIYKSDKSDNQVVTFSIVPSLKERSYIDPKVSYFGSHFEINNDGIEAAKLMGFRAIRLNSPLITKWNAIEEEKGKFVFNDNAINKLQDNDFLIIGSLDRTAYWASSGKSDPRTKSSNYYGAYSYMPYDMIAWKNYVTSVLKHYKDTIKYWQIWNEPDIPFLVPYEDMTHAETYKVLEDETYLAIDKVQTQNKYIGGVAHLYKKISGKGRQADFLENAKKLNIFNKNDIITFHYYYSKNSNSNTLTKDSQNFKKLNNFKNTFGNKHDYWITEFGFDCTKSTNNLLKSFYNDCMDMDRASELAIKFNIKHIAEGIKKIFFYDMFFDSAGWGDYWKSHDVLWDSKKPRPLVQAYSILTWLVDGKTFKESEFVDNLAIYKFQNEYSTLQVMWSEGNTIKYNVKNENVKVYDMYGKDIKFTKFIYIGTSPIYIIDKI